MEQDTLNDKADAALIPALDAEPVQPVEGIAVSEGEISPENESVSVNEVSADSEPVSDENGHASEADPKDNVTLALDEDASDAVSEELADFDASGADDGKGIGDVGAADGFDGEEPDETITPAPDVPADRSAEILDTLARYQDAWNAEQMDIREKSEQLLQEVSGLTGKVALFTTTTAAMTVTIQKLADDSEQLVRWSEDVKSAGTLSKLFQVVAILVLVMLLGGMSYLALQHQQALHHLHAAEAAVAEAIKLQQKQIAEYDKHFAVLVGTEIKKEREISSKVSILEKLNRLRNGLAEQQLYRKTNGDWFVVTGKAEVALSDPDLIEQLNQAYIKSGRALTTPYLVPPHKVITLLRPNGQGGTDIVVTKELAP